ncbi:MAG: amino acid ABC transporter substrate-binding protein [Verrucomicrobia bacterium]|nr:amino acid ABC transporter substrate-binding protein [Verrucomicrobiota bacterium]
MNRYKRLSLVLLFSLGIAVSCFFGGPSKTHFKVLCGSSWPGINLHGKTSNVQGFIDDLFFAIASGEDIRISITRIDSGGRMFPHLDDQGVDGVVSVAATTTREERQYAFSDPFFAYGPVLVIRSNDAYNSLAMLKDKVVGYERGYGGDFATRNDFEVIFRPYDQMTYAMEDLIHGQIDAVILDSVYANQLLSGLYATALKIVYPPLKETSFQLVVKKGENEELIELFNKGLKEQRANGEYTKLLDYWGLFDPTLEH